MGGRRNFLKNIYLAASGLSYGTWNFHCIMQDLSLQTVGSLVTVHGLNCSVACGNLVPRPGIEPESSALQGGSLTTGRPGKSCNLYFSGFCHIQKNYPWTGLQGFFQPPSSSVTCIHSANPDSGVLLSPFSAQWCGVAAGPWLEMQWPLSFQLCGLGEIASLSWAPVSTTSPTSKPPAMITWEAIFERALRPEQTDGTYCQHKGYFSCSILLILFLHRTFFARRLLIRFS